MMLSGFMVVTVVEMCWGVLDERDSSSDGNWPTSPPLGSPPLCFRVVVPQQTALLLLRKRN